MSKKAFRGCLSALLLACASAAAGAFTLEPMTTLLSPSGEGRVATFRINNNSQERIALRFSVMARSQSPEGREVNSPADDLFVVYPARLLVEAGASASVKVQWRGPSKVEVERSFRFFAEQMPIDAITSRNGASAIKIMFRYIASLYVGESRFAPELSVKVTGASGPGGGAGYLVEIGNSGLRHVVAVDASVEIASEGGITLSAEDLGELSGANYLAGTKRSVFVPRPEAIVGTSYDAKINYDMAY